MSCPEFEMVKIQRPGTTLWATGGPRGGTPKGRSASGHGAQAAPVVCLLTLARAARWRTVAGEQNHVSTHLSSCPVFVFSPFQNACQFQITQYTTSTRPLLMYSRSHLGRHLRILFQRSKLKARTYLLHRFSEKRHSIFELWALKELSKMSPQVGLAVMISIFIIMCKSQR